MVEGPSLLILGAWLGLAVVFVGVGLVVSRPSADAARWLLGFWLGWIATLFVLQLWHLLLPVDGRALTLVAAIAVCGYVVRAVASLRAGTWPRPSTRGVLHGAPFVTILIVAAAWLATHALNGPTHGDSGAYFLPTVRWLATYPIVPGLANLHVPYGFNQSYFLYAAMLDVGPFAHRAYHLANGLLILALFARGVLGLQRLVRWDRRGSPADLFHALFVPVTVELALGLFLTSPSPDLPVFVLGVVLSGELIAFLTRATPERGLDRDLVAIAWLVVGGLTVKLSFVGLAGTTALIVALVWLVRDRPSWANATRTAVAIAAVAIVGLGPWVGRNVVLSGCPFYPSTFGALPVEWLRTDAIAWIRAPMHFGATFFQALRSPTWLATRLETLGWFDREVMVPAAILGASAVVAIVVLAVRLVRGGGPGAGRPSVVILLPPLASLVFIFWTAPMSHYGGATFWLIAIESVVLAVAGVVLIAHPVPRLFAATSIVAVAAFVLIHSGRIRSGFTEFQFAPIPPSTETHLANGLVVRVAAQGQCYDIEPPCTPELVPGLRLRRAGELASGFVIDRPRDTAEPAPQPAAAPAEPRVRAGSSTLEDG